MIMLRLSDIASDENKSRYLYSRVTRVSRLFINDIKQKCIYSTTMGNDKLNQVGFNSSSLNFQNFAGNATEVVTGPTINVLIFGDVVVAC